MNKSDDMCRLRIYVSSTDKMDNQPVYEKIVFEAKKSGLAGATVFRGVMGYGASSVVHSSKLWELTEKLPVVVEIVDERARVVSFYQNLEARLNRMSKGCLVTLEKVDVLLYKEGKQKTAG
ncbi:MAG: DUF190 domain-containing protein [Bacteroidales bacterium]|nr:DUF190 domain-containing protein [Bacteroidales bacterium]